MDKESVFQREVGVAYQLSSLNPISLCRNLTELSNSLNCPAQSILFPKSSNVTTYQPSSPVQPSSVVVSLRPGDSFQIPLTVTPPQSLPIDLYILMDLTKSLEPYVNGLKTTATKLITTMQGLTSKFRIAFGSYVDKRLAPFSDRESGSRKAVGGSRKAVGGSRKAVGGSCKAVGGSRKAVGGSRKAVGGSRKAVGGSRKAVGGSRKAVGGSRKAVGGSRKAVGGSRKAVGGSRKAVGGSRKAVGGSRKAVGGSRKAVGGSRKAVGGSHKPVGGSRKPMGSSLSWGNAARSGAEHKSFARSGAEHESFARSGAEHESFARSGAEHKSFARSGAERESFARSGAEHESFARSGAEHKSFARSGAERESFARSGAEHESFASLDNPCDGVTATGVCNAVYDFHHTLNFTDNATLFMETLNASNVSANLDTPDALLDALLQIALCEDQVGWSPAGQSRRIVFVMTTGDYHYALDGTVVCLMLAGLVNPPSLTCRLSPSGVYQDSELSDYPSAAVISQVLNEKRIIPIFAHIDTFATSYVALANRIKSAFLGKLLGNENNLPQVLSNTYTTLSSTVIPVVTGTNNERYLSISVSPQNNCAPGWLQTSTTNTCVNITVNTTVRYIATLTVAKEFCAQPSNSRTVAANIQFIGFGDLRLNISVMCQPCQSCLSTIGLT
eukprot:Em0011g179a